MGISDEFTKNERVTVRSFEATVTNPWHAETATTQLRDDNGNTHYVLCTQLEKVAPYTDGVRYIDNDDDVFTFHRRAGSSAPYWTNEHGYERNYTYPARPLRPIGDAIDE